MRAYDRAGQSNEPKSTRARSSTPTNTEAERIIGMHHTVGNAEVASVISGQSVQRVEDEQAERTGRRGTVAQREQQLSQRFGIRIGLAQPDGRHFSHAELDRIEAALDQLPIGDLRDNEHLLAIEMDPNPQGSASLYRSEHSAIRMVRPVVMAGFRAPGWLYAALNTGSSWQRGLMDRQTVGTYAGVGREGDQALGVDPGSRQVFGAQGNLMKWTTRHEVGHAVDQNVGWDPDLAQQEHFGGWTTYSADEIEPVAEAVLRRSGLDAVIPHMAAHEQATARWSLISLLHPATIGQRVGANGITHYLQRFRNHLPEQEFADRSATFTRFVQMAMAQPWMLGNGGSDALDVGGRIYQLDSYGTWVSYSAAQRAYMVSPYQFASPGEWFAEAYSAYYNLNHPELRGRLNPAAAAWFATRPAPAGEQASET